MMGGIDCSQITKKRAIGCRARLDVGPLFAPLIVGPRLVRRNPDTTCGISVHGSFYLRVQSLLYYLAFRGLMLSKLSRCCPLAH